jgi:hypothetical protein
LVDVEKNKVVAQDVLVGRVGCMRAQGTLMLDAKEVLVRVASDCGISEKKQYLECL